MEDTREITLTMGKVTLVDAADYEALMQWRWFTFRAREGVYYAQRSNYSAAGPDKVYMHRHIMGVVLEKRTVDHINLDTLDNRRSNLRLATYSENQHNRPAMRRNANKVKGVSFHKASGKYRAQIGLKGEIMHLGLFSTLEEAHAAYCVAARLHHGEFARFA